MPLPDGEPPDDERLTSDSTVRRRCAPETGSANQAIAAPRVIQNIKRFMGRVLHDLDPHETTHEAPHETTQGTGS